MGKPHPWDSASCVSKFWMLWLWPILVRGAKQPLQQADLFDPPKHLRAASIDEQQLRSLAKSRTKQQSISRLLLGAFGWRYPLTLFVFSIWLISLLSMPVLSDRMFEWLDSDHSTGEGLALGLGMVLSYLVNCNAGCQWYQQTTQLGCEFRTAAALVVFRRLLKLKIQDTTKERAMNLVQVDAERLYIFAQLSHLPFVAILVISAASVMLIIYESVIVAVVVLAVVLGTIVLQLLISRISGPARVRTQHAADERVGMLAQVLDSFKVLKMYGWLPAVFRRLESMRERELGHAALYLALRAFSSAASYCSPTLAMLATLAVIRDDGKPLTAHRVFLIYNIINLVRAPLGGLAIGVSAIIDGRSALRRLDAFLVEGGHMDVLDEDLHEIAVACQNQAPTGELDDQLMQQETKACGAFLHVDVQRPDAVLSTSSFKLDMDAWIRKGELVAIVGRVAAGKSSVLLALLGEMFATAGTMRHLKGRVAYMAQSPWLRSGTVREGILQDLPYDEKKYWHAIRAAQLMPDLDIWPAGDETFVGGKGVTVSGGQRARLGLAHLLYRVLASPTPIELILMDDCLAAVDAHVARGIVEEALLGLLVDKSRSVVMVLNSNFLALDSVDRILSVQDGKVSNFDDVPSWLGSVDEETRKVVRQTMTAKVSAKSVAASQAASSSGAPSTFISANTVIPTTKPKPSTAPRDSSLSSLGSASAAAKRAPMSETLGYYLGAGSVHGGYLVGVVLFLPLLGAEALRVYADYFMGVWAADAETVSESETNSGYNEYMIWCFAMVVMAFFRAWFFMGFAVRSSSRIHNSLVEKLAEVPVSYFDTTPTGHVLNHFSKDFDSLDSLLPQNMLDFLQDIITLLGVVVVVIWSTPPSAVAVVPVLLGFYTVRVFFSRTARESRRLDSIARAPLYSAVGDAAEGLATIRAHRQSLGLVRHFAGLVDENCKAFFQNYILQPWCILILDSFGAAVLFATAISCVFLRSSLDTNTATMAITYALMTRGKLQFCIRLSVEAENQLIAVERIKRLQEELPMEEEVKVAPTLSPSWPTGGKLELREVTMRYRPDLPPALNGLNLAVDSGAKIGLVGRTGSGKSSLLSAVLRLVELEKGSIWLDGQNIREVPLQRLRGAFSVIPQDPVLWSGSLAFNLDPESSADNESMLRAIAAVGLSKEIEDLGGLEGLIEARGSNLSLGQRQLLCVARGVLQRRPVVILDEATSSMDGVTDARIQATFKEQFVGRTLLVVAHRVSTILDADRIVVLEAGSVVESGCPKTLCADANSQFSRLAAAAGYDPKAVHATIPSSPPREVSTNNLAVDDDSTECFHL